MHQKRILILCAFLLFSWQGYAQLANANGITIGKPWLGNPGIQETVSQIMAREAAHPFVFDPNKIMETKTEEGEENKVRRPKRNKLSPRVSRWPAPDPNQVIGRFAIPATTYTVSTGFDSNDLGSSGYIPPDSNGAAGPSQILVASNGRIRVFSKQGVLGPLDVTTNTFFNSVRDGSTSSDPHVRYDRLSGRWFVTMINVSTPNRVMIAVSSGSVITSQSSFTFFQFTQDQVGTVPNADTGALADYDTFGLDANALYIGVNMFAGGATYIGTSAFIIRKSALLSGSLVVTVFRQLCTSSGAGIYTPQGVDNDDPAATEGYLIGVDNASYGKLVMKRISDPGGTPVLSANLNITVPTTVYPQNQPAQGSTKALDAIDDRLYAAMIKKNKLTGVSSLWTAHTNEVNSSGVSSSSGNRNGVRWYEVGNLTTTPALLQSGTLYDPASSNPVGYWFGSVAANGQGHMFLGCSSAGTNSHAQISVSGHLNTDVSGITDAPVVAQTSSSNYNVQSSTPQRWGDYSQLTVDPQNDQDVWAFQEYCNANNSWMVRAIKLMAPPPADVTSATPSTVSSGLGSVSVVITGTQVNSSGFFDPGTGFPDRLGVSVSGGVTVTGVQFDNPTQITLTLNTNGASQGLQTVTVTNPDGQTTSGAVLTISAPAAVLNLKAFIQGFYLGGGQMVAVADPGGHIALCDTVTVALANVAAPNSIAYTDRNVLMTDGMGSFAFPSTVLGQSYYIVFKHRNSLETWSAFPVTFSSSNISYDFTTAANKAYGNNMKNIGGAYCIYSGDVTQDGVIESGDYSQVENSSQLFIFAYYVDDVTGDDLVESADYSLIENNSQMFLISARP